jgi:2-hydroxyacyl-CoA lyase
VDDLNLPFVSSPMGRGAIPDDHPLNVGAARSSALRGADTVLVVGARLNWVFGFGRTLAPGAKVIQVDIEPEEIGRSRAAEVGIVGDAGTVLRQLLGALEGKSGAARDRAAESPWLSDLREHRARNEAALAPLMASDAVPMTHHRLFRELRDFLPRECIVTVDGQITFGTARQLLPSYLPATRLNPGTNGCMGVGVPFAIGAALARPDLPVLSVNGDAAFGFNGMEVETALRYDLPIVFVVDNNDGIMGSVLESRLFKTEHHDRVAMYRPGSRYDRVIEAFGGHAEHVDRPDEIRPALERAFASGRASLINVRVDPAAMWPPPTAGRGANALMGY